MSDLHEPHGEHGDSHHHAPPRPGQDDTLTYWRKLERVVRELLIDKGLATAEEIRAQVEDMDKRTPERGARVVARAWTDAAFKARLLEDGNAAVAELGFEHGPFKLVVVENTAAVHNLVVCTLCSCYPRWLLGLPPDWYKSRAYRARAVHEPRAVLAEFGTALAPETVVRVHDSTADMRYLVLPRRPADTADWSEEALAGLVGRDALIGVTVPRTG